MTVFEPSRNQERISVIEPAPRSGVQPARATGRLLAQLQVENQRLRRETQRLIGLSDRDQATQLYSRRHFDQRLRYEWNRAERFWTPLSLVVLSVDDFKWWVDTAGLTAAQAVLRRCSRLLSDHCREVDIPCRVSDCEFAVILPGTNRTGTEAEVSRLRKQWLRTSELPALPETCAVNISFGMAVAFDEAQSPLELLMVADESLFLDRRQQDHERSPTTPAPARPTWIDAA
ncbi:MAG: hypothetical protein DRI90_11150 [Deltaproteobacteria bacterium]|nr:MAG: hypothetical protein DRI90_11150 [Deltaproteobacteria bacterium]